MHFSYLLGAIQWIKVVFCGFFYLRNYVCLCLGAIDHGPWSHSLCVSVWGFPCGWWGRGRVTSRFTHTHPSSTLSHTQPPWSSDQYVCDWKGALYIEHGVCWGGGGGFCPPNDFKNVLPCVIINIHYYICRLRSIWAKESGGDSYFLDLKSVWIQARPDDNNPGLWITSE